MDGKNMWTQQNLEGLERGYNRVYKPTTRAYTACT